MALFFSRVLVCCCFLHIIISQYAAYSKGQSRNSLKLSRTGRLLGKKSPKGEENGPTTYKTFQYRNNPDTKTQAQHRTGVVHFDYKPVEGGITDTRQSTEVPNLRFMVSSPIPDVGKDETESAFHVPIGVAAQGNEPNGLRDELTSKNSKHLSVGAVNGTYHSYTACGPRNACLCFSLNGVVRKAFCSQDDLNYFPSNLPPQVSNVDVSSNNISHLDFSSLVKYKLLQTVYLTNNTITNITALKSPSASLINILYLDTNKLRDISGVHFGVLTKLTNLSLKNNSITKVTNRTFSGMQSLTYLDLSINQIKWIEIGAFDSLTNLKTLRLNNNPQLGYGRKTFGPRLFEKLKSLTQLWIQGNSHERANEYYPNQVFAELPILSELRIDGLGSRTEKTPQLKNLPRISTLIIGYMGRCSITDISSTFFQHVHNLTNLELWNCKFPKIESTSLQTLNRLQHYTVGYPHKEYEFNRAFKDLQGLQNSSIWSIAFVGFKPSDCNSLTKKDAMYLIPFHHLESLYLNYNSIATIDEGFLTNLPQSLETVRLRGNKFQLLDDGWNHLAYLKNLKQVDVRDQNIARTSPIFDTVEEDGSSNPLKDLDLDDEENLTDGVPFATSYESETKYYYTDRHPCGTNKRIPYLNSPRDNEVHLGNVQSYGQRFSEDTHCNASQEVCIPPHLIEVLASGFTEIGKVLLFRNISQNNLQYLDFSKAYFKNWGDGKLPRKVQIADLSDNSCDTIKSSFFPVDNSLHTLCLRNNYLGPVLSEDKNGSIFSNLKDLQYLYIGMNYIKELPPMIFKGLRNLRALRMIENKINILDINFSFMSNLIYIDLRNNVITWITRRSRQQLDELAKNHPVYLDLGWNPLPCNCKGIELFKWMYSTKVHIVKRKSLTCEDENQNIIRIHSIHATIQRIQRQCYSYTHLIIIFSFKSGVILLIVLSGFLYRNRWKLIYARNVCQIKMYGFRPRGKVPSQCIYDAYVVYSEEDRDFPLTKMIKELETKRGHKLCLEDRDFMQGTMNSNNIICAIQNSTMTLLLVSPEFVRTKELEYHTQMAMMEEYNGQSKRDLILLVRYQYAEIEHKDMTKDLLMLMNKGRFLDYPDNEGESIEAGFWDRLSDEIGHTQNEDNPDVLITL